MYFRYNWKSVSSLHFFFIFRLKDIHISFAKLGKLKSFAHCIYFDEWSPDDNTKCPSNKALVFFKIFKDFLFESIRFFIFVSNYFKFKVPLF